MTIKVAGGGAGGEAFFFSRATRIAGSISVAHGLNRTPAVVVAYSEGAVNSKIAQGTHDSTNLAINLASTGVQTVLFAM